MNIQQHPVEDAFALPPFQQPKPMLLGITGMRNVGKSTVANYLRDNHGFKTVHPFEGGKAAAEAFFRHVTGSAIMAHDMANGHLKDKPSEYLPNNASPRFYLESTGKHAGQVLGVDWTLALEVERAQRMHPGKPLVVESLVYEVDWFREQGGIILRLERPDFDGPVGISSDERQARIEEDHLISATSVGELIEKVEDILDRL